MIPVRLYRNRLIAGGNWVGAANGAIMMGIVGFLPLYMQGLMGSSTLMAGVALGAMSVAWPFGGFVGSRLVLRVRYRISAAIGGIVLITGVHAAHCSIPAPVRCSRSWRRGSWAWAWG